jgi:hypothetical protein
MGVENYYQKFVKGFSVIAKPFTKLAKMEQAWQSEYEQKHIFRNVRPN